MASILPVAALGAAEEGAPREGVLLALKLSRREDPLSVEALKREIDIFQALCRAPGEPPCPRLYDVVEQPAPGLVMEWCPTDLERWWVERHQDPTAFFALCTALAAVCRRVREYAVVSEMELGRRVVHADIKPRNVLLSESGRWLLTDFGAAKSRSVDEESWVATKMIIGTENYIAPEALFNARKPHPAAMDTWSIGCTFFALLRLSLHLQSGARLPSNGTHSHLFRTHRAALVEDVQLRQPNAFADRELDASAFPSPERLPEKDRVALAEVFVGAFGNELLEARLYADVVNLVERALQVDPARRYLDPIEMAADFEALAVRWQELARRAEGGTSGSRASAPVVMPVAASVPPPRTAPRRWGLWLSGGVAVGGLFLTLALAVVGGAAWWLRGGSPESAPASAPAAKAAPATSAPAAAATAPVLAEKPASPSATPSSKSAAPPARAPAPATSAVASPSAPAPAVTAPAAAPTASAPRSASAPRAARPKGATGSLTVTGAEAYLYDGKRRHEVGAVAPGSYELFTKLPGAEFTSMGWVDVEVDDEIVWRCGFGRCRESE